MKKNLLIIFLFITSFIYAQKPAAFIVGDGVRIRNAGNTKSEEISKVNGIRKVEIIQESKKWDDLGKKEDICNKHKWVKIKWEGDSSGWVYGKYCYQSTGTTGFSTNKTGFHLNGSSYVVQLYKNFEYPVADEEGITGCNNSYRVYFYNETNNQFFVIKDDFSKKQYNEKNMVLYSSDGISESIADLKVIGDKIIIYVTVGHQDGTGKSTYTIVQNNGEFMVTEYLNEELNND